MINNNRSTFKPNVLVYMFFICTFIRYDYFCSRSENVYLSVGGATMHTHIGNKAAKYLDTIDLLSRSKLENNGASYCTHTFTQIRLYVYI